MSAEHVEIGHDEAYPFSAEAMRLTLLQCAEDEAGLIRMTRRMQVPLDRPHTPFNGQIVREDFRRAVDARKHGHRALHLYDPEDLQS